MRRNIPQIGSKPLLRLVAALLLCSSFVDLERVAAEAQGKQALHYTIAFASLAPWDLDVFIANADGSNPRPLASHPDLDYNATFSPDGQWIVFTSHRNGNADLYRVRPDGSDLQRLTDHPAFDDAAAFSPDGTQIAFVSSRSGQADIWVMELESSKMWNVTNSPGGDFRPAWSPDGEWLAFSSDRGTWDESDIYVIKPDGTELRRLTHTSGWDGSPTWSPDGKRVTYYSANRQIFVVGINGLEPIRITLHPLAPLCWTNPPLGYAFAAPFGKGGRQTRSGWRGDFCPRAHLLEGFSDSHLVTPTQITTSSGSKLSPHWVAADRVCFVGGGNEGALGCVNPDRVGKSDTQFAARGEFRSPKWSPDGKHLVFHRHTDRSVPSVRDRPSLVPGVRLLRINGTFPSFSPTGDVLSFTADFRSIERMRIDGSDRRQLYKDTPAFMPSWSPGGDLIAFTKGRVFAGGSTNNDIYVIRPDGSGVQNITQHPANDALPSWSPDGKRLVFRSTRDGNKDLYVIDVDGTGLTRLTTSPGTDTFPHWSPLGNRIVFASDHTGDFEIYTIRPDGSDLRQLTHSPGLDMHPVWSPDGQWICFASARGGFKDERPLTGNPQPYGDLYLMRPDGSEVQALTNDQFEDGTPAWAPLPQRSTTKTK